jgi:uncharacterized protein YbjT (DUF2867 family)
MRLGRADAPFNVVPVDYIVAAIAATADEPAALGENLHLVDPEPLTTGELVDLLASDRPTARDHTDQKRARPESRSTRPSSRPCEPL